MRKNNFSKNPISFNLFIGIYGIDINVYIGNAKCNKGFKNLKRIMPVQRQSIAKLDLRGAKGQCIEQGGGCSDIYIYNADKSTPDKLAELITTIRHEVQHAATNVFNWIEDKNLQTEAFLYLNDFIFAQILNKIL